VIVWEDGKSLAFDDGTEHEAWNDSDEDRYVLFVQTRWPLSGPARHVHRVTHRVLGLPARAINRRAAELDVALNAGR
jgi:aspartyl/asparaginyl beta-hydroxylase (cupin superfamily)